MTSDNIKSGVYLVAIAAAGFIAWQAYKKAGSLGDSLKAGASTVGGWVNPASSENLVYQGLNAAGSAYTGQTDWSVGGAVYDTQQERGFSNPWQVFNPSSAGLIASEIKDFFNVKPEPLTSGGGGVFNGNGASGKW